MHLREYLHPCARSCSGRRLTDRDPDISVTLTEGWFLSQVRFDLSFQLCVHLLPQYTSALAQRLVLGARVVRGPALRNRQKVLAVNPLRLNLGRGSEVEWGEGRRIGVPHQQVGRAEPRIKRLGKALGQAPALKCVAQNASGLQTPWSIEFGTMWG